MTDRQQVLGLIAGEGRFPFIVAKGARDAGLKVICAGLGDSADESLTRYVDKFFRVSVARPGSWIRKLKKHGVTETVMVGRVAKSKIFTPFRILKYLPDWIALKIWYWTLRGKDKRNDTLLCALADELEKGGIKLQDSTKYCKEHFADKGPMTKHKPPMLSEGDIEFGFSIVKKLAGLDIGQAIAVKEREILAVEAIEGTAEMILRAGKLCKKGGWILLKVSKPNQDMRFDVPCVGTDTIQALSENGGKCLVVEAGKVLILDKSETLALADKLGIAIIGR
jgi:DUF1009 family protein